MDAPAAVIPSPASTTPQIAGSLIDPGFVSFVLAVEESRKKRMLAHVRVYDGSLETARSRVYRTRIKDAKPALNNALVFKDFALD
jgi:hypothetical protein